MLNIYFPIDSIPSCIRALKKIRDPNMRVRFQSQTSPLNGNPFINPNDGKAMKSVSLAKYFKQAPEFINQMHL